MNGNGTLTKADGEQITGNWKDGEFIPEEYEDNGTPWRHLRKIQKDVDQSPISQH